jgi:serine/threonine protein kinase
LGWILFDNRKLPPHPNVVQMFGVSLDGSQPVIVMEYCTGGTQTEREIKHNKKRKKFSHMQYIERELKFSH